MLASGFEIASVINTSKNLSRTYLMVAPDIDSLAGNNELAF